MTRIALACGHTGGHLIPARLVAQQLHHHDADTVLYSTASPDHWLLQSFPGAFVPTRMEGWSGRGPVGKARSLGLCIRDFVNLKDDVRNCQGVIGFGGYSSIPVLLAGWTAGVPIFLQEQNRIGGKANQLFLHTAQRLFCGFPPINEVLPVPLRVLGNPVRRLDPSQDPWTQSDRLLVVIGGSQGARELSEHLESSAPPLLEDGWKIYYVKGTFGRDYRDLPWAHTDRFRQVNYSEDLPAVLAHARCAWTRAGAGTLSELLYYEVPSVIFPLRGSADNHQLWNARWVSEHGPAVIAGPGIRSRELLDLTRELSTRERKYHVPWPLEPPPEQNIVREVLSFV